MKHYKTVYIIITCKCNWLFSLQVYRHGDRSPTGFFPTDKNKNFWPQGLGQLTQVAIKNLPFSFYFVVFLTAVHDQHLNVNTLHGICKIFGL